MKVCVIGVGMGSPETLSGQAREAIASCEVLIGAQRLLDSFGRAGVQKKALTESAQIVLYLNSLQNVGCAGILMSGDVGFYSGAKKLIGLLENFGVTCVSGISSLQYFCAALNTSWDDVKVVSLHGRDADIAGEVRTNKKVFVLTDKINAPPAICERLIRAGLENCKIYVGENLSYPEERIRSFFAREIAKNDFDSLAVMLIENPGAKKRGHYAVSDGDILRGDVPMTKEEVRSVSVAKLRIGADDVVYDIGAGTGSVSVELARAAYDGCVYAVEMKEDALALLEQNKAKFELSNLHIIAGKAPDALLPLPRPAKAFIGGSAGNMRGIIEALLEKNPAVRITINLIALQSLSDTLNALSELKLRHVDIVQLTVAKARQAGDYHLMMGQNPVYIITAFGGGDE